MQSLFGGGRIEPLKELLFKEYGGFSDKRIKSLRRGNSFIIDDRLESDIGADRQPLSYFCMMFAEVVSGQSLKVTLQGNIPMGPKVRAWIRQHAEKFNDDVQGGLEFTIEKGQQPRLSSLATAFRDIVAPGKRYSVSNYKYVCPRTADSLERLKKVLDGAWSA